MTLPDRDPAPEVAPCRAASAPGISVQNGVWLHRRLQRLRGHRRLGRISTSCASACATPMACPASAGFTILMNRSTRAHRRCLRGLGARRLVGAGRPHGDRGQDPSCQPLAGALRSPCSHLAGRAADRSARRKSLTRRCAAWSPSCRRPRRRAGASRRARPASVECCCPWPSPSAAIGRRGREHQIRTRASGRESLSVRQAGTNGDPSTD
jgi:hypothetical protein